MSITGILGNAFGAVKEKGIIGAKIAARQLTRGTRIAGAGDDFARRLGSLNFDNGDEILAGMGGVMRGATTSNTTSRTASTMGRRMARGASNLPAKQVAQNFTAGGRGMSNLPAKQIAQNFTPGRGTSNINWGNVANQGLTRGQKAGLAGAGIGAALARAGGGRRRSR